jgi:hypothetical protein
MKYEAARHPYVNGNGELLYEVIRHENGDGSKSFVQQRPSGVDAAGTTGVPTGGIVLGLGAGKYRRDLKAEYRTRKPKSRPVKDDEPVENGETVCSFRECPRVPYHLQAVLFASEVYIVEGEKCVHTAEEFGLVATCNSGGSGVASFSMNGFVSLRVSVSG